MKKFFIGIREHYETILYVFCSLLTLVCAVSSNFVDSDTVWGTVVYAGLLSGFSLDLLMILWGFSKLKDSINVLRKYVKQEECIHFDICSKAAENNKLIEIISKETTGSIYIFCYGTNLYGKLIPEIIRENNDNNKNFRINLAICNPDSPLIDNRKDDIRQLKEKIKICVANKKHFDSLYILSTPKTFRSCIIKDTHKRSLRASFQPYIISDDRFLSTSNSRTPIVSACKNNGDILLCIEDILEKEWNDIERIWTNDSKNPTVQKLIENGEVIEFTAKDEECVVV